jgi:ABC-2 type transport system permease protein
MSTGANVLAVARREFTVRVRTRSFLIGTLALVLGVVLIAFVPVILRYVDRTSSQHVAVWTEPSILRADPTATIGAVLNAPTGSQPVDPSAPADFVVTSVPDLDAARAAVTKGTYAAALAVRRTATGDLAFTLYTNDSATGRLARLVQAGTMSLAVGDRLDRLGVAPAEQSSLFAPTAYTVSWPDPARTDPTRGGLEEGSNYLLGFGMTILIFMMIVLYGNWVAMSVVEEKSSRVMEVILNAATPFQLLAGKVLGVGAVALAQYGSIVVAGTVALLAQGPIASIVLGERGGAVDLPAGLTVAMLAMLVVYGVLGFLLYAVLYAAAGSLVSRQEDVSTAVMPMGLVSTAGYLVAVYAGTGLLDIRSDWLTLLSQVPLVSPFLMLSRVMAGQAQAWEVVLSIAILVGPTVAAIGGAPRIYAAGVLLYGQRPGVRAVWRLVRQPGTSRVA